MDGRSRGRSGAGDHERTRLGLREEGMPRVQAQRKAGSEAVNFLKQEGVCLVIAGRFGSKAIEAFRTNNIQMIVPEGRQTINEIINKIK